MPNISKRIKNSDDSFILEQTKVNVSNKYFNYGVFRSRDINTVRDGEESNRG